MELQIRGNNVQITDNFKEYATQKISKLERYMPNIAHIRVDMAQQNSSRGPNIMVAQITLRHTRGAILRSEERIDMSERDAAQLALNGAVDKMYKRIRRFKGKKRNKNGTKWQDRYQFTDEELGIAEDLPQETDEMADLYADYADYEDEAVPQPPIVRRKMVGVAPMDEEEAIEQMELLGHTFFMFFNVHTSQINVLYKRDSGGYGVLEPELI